MNRFASVLLLLALLFGGTLGVLTLTAPPARAIEIAYATFTGCPSRTGAIPLTCTITVSASGAPPIVGQFGWGDGANTNLIENNGTNSLFVATHTYSVKGNYSLTVNLTDVVGATWRTTYKVSAWAVGYLGTAAVSATIEGYGLVTALQRMTSDEEGFTAYVHNTGSAYISPLTVTFYGDTWGTVCATNTISDLIVGGWAYTTASGFNINAACDTVTQIWVKVTSSSFPALNGTSPKMTVAWSAVEPAIGLSLRATQTQISVPLGGYALIQYQVTNIGFFSLDFYDTPVQNPLGSFALMPADLGNPAHALIINGTTTQTILGSTALFQGLGRILLQPGQSIYINRTIQALGSTTQSTSLTITDSALPRCPVYPVSPTPDNSLACGLSITPSLTPSVTITVSVTQIGATILMLVANPLGNGSEQFIGQIVSIGSSSGFLTTSFIFWKSADLTNRSQVSGPTMTQPGTVTVSVIGLTAGTNYSVQFSVQGVGPQIFSNVIQFVTAGVCSGAGCSNNPPPNTPSNFVAAFLTFLGAAAGVPAEIFGLLFGLAIIGTFILFLLVVSSHLEVDIPLEVFMGLLWMLVIVNVVLFLWPSWIIVLMFVFTGILLWWSLTGSGRGEASG